MTNWHSFIGAFKDVGSKQFMCPFLNFPDALIKVMCDRDYIAIRAAEDFFKYHNVPLEALHLPNKSCRVQREVINDVSYYMSRISKDKYLTCGGKLLEVELNFYLLKSTTRRIIYHAKVYFLWCICQI